MKRVTKQTGGAIAYDPTKGYKKGQPVDAGVGAIFKAKTDVKAGTAGLGKTTVALSLIHISEPTRRYAVAYSRIRI